MLGLPTDLDGELKLDVSALAVHQFSTRKTARLLGLLAAVLPVAGAAQGVNYVWDGNNGGGGNSHWSTTANWSILGAPPQNNVWGLANANLIFGGTAKLSPLMNGNYFVRSVTFAPSSGAFVLSPQGNSRLSLGAGGLQNNSAQNQTLLMSLSLSNSQTWNAAAGNLFIGGAVDLAGNLLTLSGAYNIGISNTISGAGAIYKAGLGELILAGLNANTFSGGITVSEGTVTVAKNNALGTGPLTMSGGTLNLGSYTANVSQLNLLGGTILGSGLSSASTYQFQAGTVSTTLGGSVGLEKSSAGSVWLTAANTYSGDTRITAGRLAINNTTGSGTGSGNVSVSIGGMLAGTGSISGWVTNGPGGTLSAGDEVGSFVLGNLELAGGSTLRWDLSDAAAGAGVGWDLLNVNGRVRVTATSVDKAFIDLVTFTLSDTPGAAANFNPNQNYLWVILHSTEGILFAPGESELSVFDLLTGSFVNPHASGTFGVRLSADGRDLELAYTAPTAVPEPSHFALAGLGLCALIYIRRFKRCWGTAQD